jgi:uncharacterized protein (TIGR03435 family)
MKTGIMIFATAAAMVGRAQTPSFDAASIKTDWSLGGMSAIRVSRGRVVMENVSMKKVILNAYGIPDDRDYALIGPGWLATERFDVDATFPGNTPPEQLRLMLQSLLAERFKLALHKETRQLPMYAFTVAKGGPKIHPVEEGQPKTSGSAGHMEATRIGMRKLADLLARQEGVPVTDSTGLAGVFDLTLDWSPDNASPSDSGASIFSALQEQLGLKLETRKGPVEVVVIDAVEKTPTAN